MHSLKENPSARFFLRRLRHCLPGLLAVCLSLAPAGAWAGPERWAGEIAAWARTDAPPPLSRDSVLFVGSSSIRMWTTLAADFPGYTVVNRGFGGSQLGDCLHYFDPLVLPHQPRTVVLYAGENDLSEKRSPQDVAADFEAFCLKLHAALPACRLVFVAIKPSPSRWHLRSQMVEANRLIAAACRRDPRRTFLDVYTPMLDRSGQPRAELYLKDRLHLNAGGYGLWTSLLMPLLKSGAGR